MGQTRVIIACNNSDCVRNGAPAVQAKIKEALKAASEPIEYDIYKCFGACEYGPNVMLYPQLELYSHLTPEDVPFLVERVQGGPLPPARLVADLDPPSQIDVDESREIIREDYE